MPRALVTGAAGFIGGTLVRHLLPRGWEVHALLGNSIREEALSDVRDRVAVHLHDGTTASMERIVGDAKPDVVFHLASLFLTDHAAEDIDRLVASNVLFPAQLAEAMSLRGAMRLVNTGTSWQHFHREGYRPVNLYAATKMAFEDLLAYYHDARGLGCVTLKLFDTYGPFDRRPKLVNLLLDAARNGTSLELSPGEQLLDLTHADDVASAFLAAGERLLESPAPRLESWFVSGSRLTVRELVEAIEEAAGRPVRANWGGRPYRPREVMVPADPEGRLLPGWAPAIGLAEGLRSAYLARKG